jgi:modulator of FtsH protease
MSYGYGYAPVAAQADVGERVAFIRRVYGLFFASLLLGGIGALVGLDEHVFRITAANPMACWLGELGLVVACSFLRRRRGLNLALLFAFTLVSGVVMTPYLALMAVRAGTASVIGEAFATTCLVFGGLTAYTLISKRDFSWLRGFVITALFALIGVGLLDYFFFHSDAMEMAMSAAGVMIFSCWVLYDTSNLLRRTPIDDAVGAALALYLDFINLFLDIVRLLSGRRR